MSKFNHICLCAGEAALPARRAAVRLCERAVDLLRDTKDGVRLAMRRRVKPRFWVFMITVTLIVFLASFAVMRLRYAQVEQRLAAVRTSRDELTMQVNALSEKLSFAQTDAYVIRTARDELGMIMPGEVRYVNGAR